VVKKCFKAFLLAKGRTYPRLHKVIELAALCPEMQEDLEPWTNSTFRRDILTLFLADCPTVHRAPMMRNSHYKQQRQSSRWSTREAFSSWSCQPFES
jgi:hypothetical protein